MKLNANNPNQLTQQQICIIFGISKAAVLNIVKSYTQPGLDYTITYHGNPNSNARRKVNGCSEAHIIELACSTYPEGFSRWAARLLSDHAQVVSDTLVSKSTIPEVKKHNLDLA